ncbi:T-box-containing protein TBX6L-like [Copidosoma floridanum]|uniref:T-box-containing protein TBX6L-like n=1 Tax=Copidosoma floridanum TaxID=29053 RepID=UPI0006C961F3|nr:T-box-containing protein TBX6L-like [Copidosoma floridanum]
MDYLNMMAFPYIKEHQYLAEPYRFLTPYSGHPFYVSDTYSSLPCPHGDRHLRGISMELSNRDLWRQFKNQETEMIITKSGRRMFPAIQISVRGLNPDKKYSVAIEMVLVTGHRYKYNSTGGENKLAGWTESGPAEAQPPLGRRFFWHQDGPAPGAHWEQQPLNFSKLKLTNNAQELHGNILLTSMHKYLPRIWIVQCDHTPSLDHITQLPAAVFEFPETEFIAVTAYQNENITKLKINHNPFAKGFRENGLSAKRKRGLCDSGKPDKSTTGGVGPTTNDTSVVSDDDNSSDKFDEALTPVSSQHSSPPASPKRFCPENRQQRSHEVTSANALADSYTSYRPLTPDSPDELAEPRDSHPQDLRKVKVECEVKSEPREHHGVEEGPAAIVHRPWEDRPWFDMARKESLPVVGASCDYWCGYDRPMNYSHHQRSVEQEEVIRQRTAEYLRQMGSPYGPRL